MDAPYAVAPTVKEDSESEEESGFSVPGDKTQRKLLGGCCCCILVTFAIVFPLASLRIVPPGSVGVVTTFGSVSEAELPSGTHVVNPFAGVTMFSTKTTLYEQPSRVPTAEGLIVSLDVALLYHIVPSKARDIYVTIGEMFETNYMSAQLASVTRGITGSNPAEALYNSTREKLQDQLKDSMAQIMEPRGIIIESALLKDIVLPELLKTAIETKTASEQEAERMKYVLQKEVQEAKRKEIEAKGIQKFQAIVSEGISPNLLQWKGIEATEHLVDSKNSKIVMIGNSKASLPVMMSNMV